MNRKLKFRWRQNSLEGLVWNYGEIGFGAELWIPSDGQDLCQFTGLLDKNGKEIYEGDIVVYNGLPNWKVGHKPLTVSFSRLVIYPFYQTDSADGEINSLSFWEIIGNIYENPELNTKSNE